MKNILIPIILLFILCSCNSSRTNLIGKNYTNEKKISSILKTGLNPRQVKTKLGYPLKIDYEKNLISFIPIASLFTDESERMYYYYKDFYCVFTLKTNGRDILKSVYSNP